MQYKVVFDKYNRLRLRCGNYAFSKEQALGLLSLLKSLPYITEVETNSRTGSIMVVYKKGYKQELLDYIKNIKKTSIPEEIVPESQKADEKFISDLARVGFLRILSKFLPIPIRNAITIYRASKYVIRAIDTLLSFKINVDVLDGTSIGVSVLRKNFNTASSIMFLLKISDMLSDYTRKRAKLALSEQLSLNIDNVWLKVRDDFVQVPYKTVQKDDLVLVNTGYTIPFDSTVEEYDAMVNQSTMTGESEPVHKSVGDSVFAGTTVESGKLLIRVRSLSDESRLQEIINMIDESENLKAGIQSNAERLADRIVPYSFLGFGLTFLLTRNMTKALSVLMVDFSCAIKLSTPISIISAMREAAEHGITIKGGKYLEKFSTADTIVFDKTGTLTNASPEVIGVIPFNGYERDYVLKTAACLEEHFPHSVANAVVECAKKENLIHQEEEHAEVEYLVAHGIVTHLYGERVIIGSAHFVFEDENIQISKEDENIIKEKSIGNSSIFLAIGNKLAGMIIIDDPVRKEASEIIANLRKCGIKRVCMLTGDSESAASRVAKELGLDFYVSQVLPSHKSEYVKALQSNGHTVIMVGDGINDTPALAAADVSIAMCDGSDIAREVADITLCNDRLSELVTLRILSEEVMKRIHKNYRFIVGFNSSLILLGIAGVIQPSLSALLHNSSTMLISLKSMSKLL